MATSHGSKLVLLIAVSALVLFVGTADAWEKCPKGFKDCNPHKPGCETCIANDPNNCGDCGHQCHDVYGAYAKCSDGYCKYFCKPGYANCDGKWYNGCEVHTDTDVNNCGYCGHHCPCNLRYGEPTCSGGKCGQQCKRGWKYDHGKNCCVQH